MVTTTFTICQNWLVRVSPVSRKVACYRLQNDGENGSRKTSKKPTEDWGKRVRSFSPLARFFARPHWPRAWNRLAAKRILVLLRTSQTDKSIPNYMVCTTVKDSSENFQKRSIPHFKMTRFDRPVLTFAKRPRTTGLEAKTNSSLPLPTLSLERRTGLGTKLNCMWGAYCN